MPDHVHILESVFDSSDQIVYETQYIYHTVERLSENIEWLMSL